MNFIQICRTVPPKSEWLRPTYVRTYACTRTIADFRCNTRKVLVRLYSQGEVTVIDVISVTIRILHTCPIELGGKVMVVVEGTKSAAAAGNIIMSTQ